MEGRELKDRGVEQVAANSQDFQDRAAHAIELLCRNRMEFTAEMVRSITGPPPHPNAMGAALRIASRQGLIEPVGFEEASRSAAHARVLRVWRKASQPKEV